MSGSNQVITAESFLAALGVDTHIPYTDGGYANLRNVIADLQYLGVTQVRDGLSNGANGSAPLSSFIALAQAGIHFTLVVESTTTAALAQYMGWVDQLETAVPGSVTAIEGPNEINNFPISYNGVSGFQGALNLQQAIYSSVQSDPLLSGVAVDYLTGYPTGSVDPTSTPGLANYDNQHPYPRYGQAPYLWVGRKSLGNTASPAAPAVFTETGYTTGQVDAAVQAKYTLDLLLDTAREGISKTYLYDLLDAYAPGSKQGDDGYGLFDNTKAAKPAATAIHDLTTLLQDPGVDAGSFTPAPLAYAITGLPATGNSMVLEKSDGTYVIAVWAEPAIWNNTTKTEIAAASEQVTVTLPESFASIQVYDPLQGTAAIASAQYSQSVTVTITDHPVLIEVNGPTAPPVIGLTSQVLANDTGVSSSDGITNDGLVTLTGTVSGGLNTSVSVEDGTTLLGPATLDGSGGWNFITTLAAGAHQLYAVASDGNGNQIATAPAAAILVETAPSLSISGETQTPGTTNTVLSGTVSMAPGTAVSIYNGSTLLGAAVLNNSGGWSYSAALATGTYSLNAVATDAAGDTASLASPSFTVAAAVANGLILSLSEDAYNGNAQFAVSVNGIKIGGTQSVTALHNLGQSQNFAIPGDFGSGPISVTVAFLNDAYGGTASTDRNLYVNSIQYNGVVTVENTEQRSNGSVVYKVPGAIAAAPSLAPVPHNSPVVAAAAAPAGTVLTGAQAMNAITPGSPALLAADTLRGVVGQNMLALANNMSAGNTPAYTPGGGAMLDGANAHDASLAAIMMQMHIG